MNDKYNIGKKIKDRRVELGLTQKALAGDKITRNMLSLIESGAATPSIDTLEYLSERLELPLSYLFSEDKELSEFLKGDRIKDIRMLFLKKNYSYCLSLLRELGKMDEETAFIRALCAFECGKSALMSGMLESASRYLDEAVLYSEKTPYPTDEITEIAPLYIACAKNIQSPLLEFDAEKYEKHHLGANDYEFYKYVCMDMDFEYTNPLFSKHAAAKKLLKKYAYLEAISILTELEKYKTTSYNAYAFFSIYSDLEGAYKQIGDFENAYRYSTKRMSLLQAFNS